MKLISRNDNIEEIYHKELIDSFFDTTSSMIAFLDPDFNFIRVNKKYADTGFHSEEFYIGKNHFDLYPDSENKAIFTHAVETGQNISYKAKPFQYQEFPELGTTYWDWDLIPVKDEYGKVKGLIFSLVDVTKRKMVEDELYRANELLENKVLERTTKLMLSEQRYRQIFDHTSDGIFLLDIVEGERFKIDTINPALGKMIGLKTAVLTGLYIEEVFPKDFIDIFYENCRNCLASEAIRKYEAFIETILSKIYIDITLIPIHDAHERIYRVLGICKDITQYKEMTETLMRAREEAEKANHAKSEYIANMSHELRTPLNVILSALQLFENHISSNSSGITKKYRNHLTSMRQNGLRLLRLINNLIDVTKIDANYFDVNLGNYNIVNIVETITLSVMDYVQNKNINLTFSSDVEEKIIACDIDMIERIVLNLLSNAIKFTNANGTIDVSLIDKGSSVLISVKDNGIGIPEDKQDIIFERYKQVDRLLTRKHEGSGIGLSLTKSFVEAQGGNLSFVSKPGLGSEFTIELPCKLTSRNNHREIKYTNDYAVIQRISVELSDLYSI